MAESDFLAYFCSRDEDTVKRDDEQFANRLQSLVTDEEVEGECIDLCLQYLITTREDNKCPLSLAHHISHEVANTVCKESLSKLKKKSTASTDALADGAQDAEIDGIDTSVFLPEVIRVMKDVCLKWKGNLPSVATKAQNCHLVSEHAIKNTRRKMEDRHVIMPYLSELSGLQNLQFYAVYDGHGGVEAANYAAVHLHCHLAADLRKNKPKDITESIKQAFVKTDELFVKHAQRENLLSGTTAVCAVLEKDRFHIAWLGDSQAWLVRDGKPVELMQPHKPERPDEKKRIEELGGYVVWFGAWRVNGNLSVSRAIGDANFKPYISAQPDMESFERQATDEYLVLACDGLWDTLSSTELVEEVREYIKSGADRIHIAKKLTDIAKDKGSSDNITVVVIFFEDGAASVSESRLKKEHAEGGGKQKKDGKKKDGGGGKGANARKPSGDGSGSGGSAHENVHKDTDNSQLASGVECCSSEDSPGMMNILENESSEADSSGDVHALSGDSTKNVLDPSKIHSSDDTNGEPDFAATDYDLSPPSNNQTESKSRGSDDSISLEDSQRQSDASARSVVGVRSAPHRQRRRRTSRKENRRPSRDKRKTATPPCVHSISADRKQLDISVRESCRSLSQTSSHLKILARFGARNPPQRPSCTGGLRSTNKDRWTIAVEVEDWEAIFESNKPIETTQAMNLSTHW